MQREDVSRVLPLNTSSWKEATFSTVFFSFRDALRVCSLNSVTIKADTSGRVSNLLVQIRRLSSRSFRVEWGPSYKKTKRPATRKTLKVQVKQKRPKRATKSEGPLKC